MEEKIVIAVLCGTVREGRESIKAATWVAEQGRMRQDVEIIFVDPTEFNFPLDGDNENTRDPRFSDITARADGFFVVTPEYNHGYPSSLKRMLDTEFDNYSHKPVVTAGVSSGPWGGVRVCEALLPVYHTMALVTPKAELYFPNVQDIFDEHIHMKPEYTEMYQKNINRVYDELLWYARLLKKARIEK